MCLPRDAVATTHTLPAPPFFIVCRVPLRGAHAVAFVMFGIRSMVPYGVPFTERRNMFTNYLCRDTLGWLSYILHARSSRLMTLDLKHRAALTLLPADSLPDYKLAGTTIVWTVRIRYRRPRNIIFTFTHFAACGADDCCAAGGIFITAIKKDRLAAAGPRTDATRRSLGLRRDNCTRHISTRVLPHCLRATCLPAFTCCIRWLLLFTYAPSPEGVATTLTARTVLFLPDARTAATHRKRRCVVRLLRCRFHTRAR